MLQIWTSHRGVGSSVQRLNALKHVAILGRQVSIKPAHHCTVRKHMVKVFTEWATSITEIAIFDPSSMVDMALANKRSLMVLTCL